MHWLLSLRIGTRLALAFGALLLLLAALAASALIGSQRLATSVSARTPITVYARVVPYEERQSNPAHSLVFRTQ